MVGKCSRCVGTTIFAENNRNLKGIRYTVTSALPYANGPLHIGHVAGAYLPADIFVRTLRAQGEEVLYICGSDEHGAAITLRAQKEGTTPKAIVDKYHGIIEQAFSDLGISFDVYHRTSAELHHRTAQEFFLELNAKGVFVQKTTEQFFDTEAGQFLADRYIMGTCPKCGHTDAYGDQCEKCGSTLSPKELIDPRSTLSGAEPVLKETTHWFLPLDRHEDWLKKWVNTGMLEGREQHDATKWKKHVVGQCNSWLDSGLHPRAMTRDLDWGVKVPLDGADGKVLYVWLDAPIGYISATKAWAEQSGGDWEKWWKDEQSKLVHFIGKDNIVFHSLIFPTLLKSHGGFVLPDNVPANEFLNLEGDKISTSRNWAIWLHEYLEDLPNKQDELRYVLCSILPEARDSEFTWQDFQERVNNELVAIFGNFVNRTLVLTNKYYGGSIPQRGELEPIDEEVLAALGHLPASVAAAVKDYRFRDALAKAMEVARLGNKYLADSEPWKLSKTDPERVKTIMNIAAQITALAAVLLDPFLPFSSQRLREMLNMGTRSWSDLDVKNMLPSEHKVNKAQLLFEKIEDELVEQQLTKLKAASEARSKAEMVQQKNTDKPAVEFEDVLKMDIRIATIMTAEKVAGADKLLKLVLDTGGEERTVVSGIAEHYSPEEVLGTQVVLLANLAPKKIRGVMSQGMVLMAENSEGRLAFVTPDKALEAGSTVR